MTLVLSVLSLCDVSLRLEGPDDTGAISVVIVRCITETGGTR